MQAIQVSELRAKLPTMIARVQRGESIIITSHGKAVAKLSPVDDRMKDAKERLAELRKTAVVRDVLSPIDIGWKAGR